MKKENKENTEIIEAEVVENSSKEDDFVMPLNEEEKPKNTLPNNSKPFWTMRIAGGIIDAAILFLCIIGLNQLFMLSGIGKAINNYQYQMEEIRDEYLLKPLIEGSEETCGHKLYEGQEDYDKVYTSYNVYTEEETGLNYIVVLNDDPSKEIVSAFNSAIQKDAAYKNLRFDWMLASYGMTMLSGFIAESVFLFAVPMLNKRRATLGKMAAGTQLIDIKYQRPPKWYQMLGRFSFQFFIESALPYLFVTNTYLYLIIAPAVLYLLSLLNKNKRVLHDYVSRTMVIDKRTFKTLDME